MGLADLDPASKIFDDQVGLLHRQQGEASHHNKKKGDSKSKWQVADRALRMDMHSKLPCRD